MAAHKGKFADIGLRSGYRQPQALTILPSVPGALFELFSNVAQRRTIMVWADSAVRITRETEMRAECAVRVINRLHSETDLWLVIFGRMDLSGDTAIRVVRPVRSLFDTSIRSYRRHAVAMVTAQRITMPADLLADAGQTIFAVLIDQDHEIQT
ncbi:MAG: hypothetical protein RBS34_16400 [Desulfofustis sp.]|nr:hypothetical protein [Desulfofustis sp.]